MYWLFHSFWSYRMYRHGNDSRQNEKIGRINENLVFIWGYFIDVYWIGKKDRPADGSNRLTHFIHSSSLMKSNLIGFILFLQSLD